MERGDCVEGGGAVSRTVSCCQDDEWMPAPAVRALMGAAALYIIHTPLCERLLTALKSAAETHKSTQNTHTSSPSGGGAAQVRTGRPLAKRVAALIHHQRPVKIKLLSHQRQTDSFTTSCPCLVT